MSLDTNVLIRIVVEDDLTQTPAARKLFSTAEAVAIGVSCLCEFAWVLRNSYGFATADVAEAMKTLLSARAVEVDWEAVEAGLDVLDCGGDFADGVIAFEGAALGGEVHMTFDKKAIRVLRRFAIEARAPSLASGEGGQ